MIKFSRDVIANVAANLIAIPVVLYLALGRDFLLSRRDVFSVLGGFAILVLANLLLVGYGTARVHLWDHRAARSQRKHRQQYLHYVVRNPDGSFLALTGPVYRNTIWLLWFERTIPPVGRYLRKHWVKP